MINLRDASIRSKLSLLIGVFVAGFVAFIAVAFRSLEPELERSDFKDVVVMKDVIADVLPPPIYVLEPYVVLLELGHQPAELARLEKRWEALEAAYVERQAKWQSELPEGRLRETLAREVTQAATAFFELGRREVFPAARAGDRARLDALLANEVPRAYAAQRAAIDGVVHLAEAQAKRATEAAADAIGVRKRELLGLGFGITALGALIAWLVGQDIARRVARTAEALERVAQGDFTHVLEDDARDELGAMAKALNTAVGAMGSALGEVQALSESLTGAATQLRASAETIAAGAHEQAASLEETAASLEEVTATVRQSSDNATQASQLAVGSREVAERGGDVVTRAIGAMGEIDEASGKIADIIATIDEIAFQTNILALNAAVEAARAGEQGRGFAVVAEQVGHLSQRSAAAAKEIKALIQDSAKKVSGGTELVNRSGQSLGEIVTSVRRVTDLVGEMATAFREQSTALEQVNQAIAQMDAVTQSNSALTEQLSSTAGALADHAERMREVVAGFQLGTSAPRSPGVARALAPRPAPTTTAHAGRASPRRAGRARAINAASPSAEPNFAAMDQAMRQGEDGEFERA